MVGLLKSLVKKYVGTPAWIRLTEFRQEFKVRNIQIYMDTSVHHVIGPLLADKGFYLDSGAHDGRCHSNTYHLEKAGWGGILIEPVLVKYFKSLQYRSRDSNIFVNAACVSPHYPHESMKMIYCDLMSFAPSISEVDVESWIQQSKPFMNPNEVQIEIYVPTKTLNTILQEVNSPHWIDFLSIDVEGAELSVLEGLNLDIYEFGIVCIETMNVGKIQSIFENYNYERIGYENGNLLLKSTKQR